jgi:tRNA-binding protein
MSIKSIAEYSSFAALDIRVGKILKVEDSNTKKPTYRITVDFGAEIGTKVSCGAFRNYQKEELVGKQIIGVVDFAPKKMGPEISEVLILGPANQKSDTIYLAPQSEVSLGAEIF